MSTSLTSTRPQGTSTPAMSQGERQYLIGGNWKCNGTLEANRKLIDTLNQAGPIPSNVEVVVCAPYPYLFQCLSLLRDDMAVGGQDCGSNANKGAYTGEVGAFQLKDIGCSWVIVGHSERRAGFGGMAGEAEGVCAQKCKIAIDAGLKVMFAIGEKKEEREAGTTMEVCAKQLEPLLAVLTEDDWDKVAIAYEPVWAIGTGLTATPAMAQETHMDIRQWIADKVAPKVAQAIRIQYGGSMKGTNAKALLAQPDIDGGLIGGASLTEDFYNVISAVP